MYKQLLRAAGTGIISLLFMSISSAAPTEEPPPPTEPLQSSDPAPFSNRDALCPDLIKMPGVVYFSEKQLNFANASSALEDLQKHVENPQTSLDLTSLANDLTVLRGAIYRLTLEAQREQSGKTDPALLKQFCDFLQADAVLRR